MKSFMAGSVPLVVKKGGKCSNLLMGRIIETSVMQSKMICTI